MRTSREEWAKRVERWKNSGLTAKEFAGELGFNPRSLVFWKWQLGRAARTPSKVAGSPSRAGFDADALRRTARRAGVVLIPPGVRLFLCPEPILCAVHHRAVHRGQLIVEGRVSTGLSFRHAGGARYGAIADPGVAEAHARAFRALRALGFREGETDRALAQARADAQVGNANTERVLRALITPG
jgi:hypothetical protein